MTSISTKRDLRLEIVLVTLVAVLVAFYTRHEYIPPFADRQVAASERLYHFDVGEPGPWFSTWALGDGQAFVLIALDPTGKKLSNEVAIPTYRFVRAGYGWLGWALSFGHAEWVPYSLALVGLLSLLGILTLAIRLRPRLGPQAWILLLNPAVYIGFGGDTAETLGIFLLILALAYGSWVAAVALGFTRPTFAAALWAKWRLLFPAVGAGLVLAAYGLLVFADKRLAPANGVALPLFSYARNATIWNLLLALAAVITIVVGFMKRDWAWVVAGAFVLTFGDQVLLGSVNGWRTAGFLPVLWAFGPGYRIPLRASSAKLSGSRS